MASAIESQHLNGGSNVNGGMGTHKAAPPLLPTMEAPPSPPVTETDTEPGSPPPQLPARPETSRIDTSVAGAEGRSGGGSPVVSPVTSPPYWLHGHSHHARTASWTSVDSIPTGGITLQDNENSGVDDRNHACWAKSVAVTDYVVVNGSATNIGAFVVWNIKVETLTVSHINSQGAQRCMFLCACGSIAS
jgi:hypothetical protein